MCLSPHEMNSARIEEDVAWYKARLESGAWEDGHPLNSADSQVFSGRLDGFEKLLKERADEGTYDQDFESEAYR